MYKEIKDFYPTPNKLIKKMIDNVDFDKIKNILEPSAGKGDICDFLNENYNYCNIDVIEIDENLQHILKSKNYNLIYNDFLKFDTFKKYDLIIANFPFSDGDKHLLQSIKLLEKNGGVLICLINSETLKNKYTNLRKIIGEKLKLYNANIQYLQEEFISAERKTNVEVALIKVIIEKTNSNSLILENLKKSDSYKNNDFQTKNLIEKDFIKSLIARFNIESKIGIRLINEWENLKNYMLDGFKKDTENTYERPILNLIVKDDKYGNLINNYLEELRDKYWTFLITNKKFTKNFTSNINNELQKKVNDLRNCNFDKFNIDELRKELSIKLVSGIEDSIIKLFDELSYKFSYFDELSKNVHYFNGWKTNKSYKIGKKAILPINGFSSYSFSNKDKLDNYYVSEKLQDMIKVFNYLDNNIVEINQLVNNEINKANNEFNFKNLDFHYFSVTFYKKGTCHIIFKNDELLKKFNIYGCQKKGWLPPSYGKKKYNEMNKEEKIIVDEFQGENDYNNIILNKDYYIVENINKFKMLNESN